MKKKKKQRKKIHCVHDGEYKKKTTNNIKEKYNSRDKLKSRKKRVNYGFSP